MNNVKLPVNAGEKVNYPLSEIYSSSLTVVSYLSSDPKVGGTYKDLFSPSIVSTSEENGLFGLVSKFILTNYSEAEISTSKKASLEDKVKFLEDEGYFAAPIFATQGKNKKYSAIVKDGYKEVGGIITTRGAQQEQAQMLTKELNGEPFVFNILYQNSKADKDDLTHPLYAVVNMLEVKEAADQISLKESKELAKRDWQSLNFMSDECKKNCWMEAIAQDARAFSLVPDEIRGNQWSIIAAVKKTQQPEVILSCAKDGNGLVKACDSLLKMKAVSFNQLPQKLQECEVLSKHIPSNWAPKSSQEKTKDKDVTIEK